MSESIAITNVKVFDGKGLTDERTVVIDNGVISDATTADGTINGQSFWPVYTKVGAEN